MESNQKPETGVLKCCKRFSNQEPETGVLKLCKRISERHANQEPEFQNVARDTVARNPKQEIRNVTGVTLAFKLTEEYLSGEMISPQKIMRDFMRDEI